MTDLTTPMSHPTLPEQPRQSPISQPIPLPVAPPVAPPPAQWFAEPLPGPAPRGRRVRLVLAIACAVAFAAAAVAGWLYVAADGDHDAALARLDERSATLSEVRTRLGAAEDARADAQARNAELETENATLTTCVDAVRHYLWDGLEDGPERNNALDAMFTACQ